MAAIIHGTGTACDGCENPCQVGWELWEVWSASITDRIDREWLRAMFVGEAEKCDRDREREP